MPVIISDNSVQGQANKSADLTAKKAGDLAAATVHLFTNDFVPTPTATAADFTEATFTGYAPVAVAGWNADEYNIDGSVSTDATNVMTWVGPGDASGQTIRGYYVLSAGLGTPYLYAVLFDDPVGLNHPTDVLGVVVTFKLP